MAVMTTGTIPRSMWPGIKEWFGRQYKEHDPQYKDLFSLEKSSRAWEELSEVTGFGLAGVKNEGSPTTYVAEAQGMFKRATHVAYSLGFIVTREERDDNQYPIVGKRRAQALAFSFRQTKEVVAANVYNRAFNSSYTGGDGVELCSTSHITADGTQSNTLSTAADISEAAVEDLCIMIMTATNSKGLEIKLTPQSLHVHPNDYFEICRIYESPLQNDTGNNAINALKRKGMFPKGVHANNYFTDTDAFFIRTNCPVGMMFFQRTPVEFRPDNDYDTDNDKYKGYERYIPTWADWRAVYGSAGA